MLRTGNDYLESLRDGRQVLIGKERVADVTTHRAFRNTARSFARIYDLKRSPEHVDAMSYEENDQRGHERREGVVANERVQIAARKREHGARRAASGARHVEHVSEAARHLRRAEQQRDRGEPEDDAARTKNACACVETRRLSGGRVCVWHVVRLMRFFRARLGRSPAHDL